MTRQNGYLLHLSIRPERALNTPVRTALIGVNGSRVPFSTKREAIRAHNAILRDWRRGYHRDLLTFTSASTGFSAHNNSQTREATLCFRAAVVGRLSLLPNYEEVPA